MALTQLSWGPCARQRTHWTLSRPSWANPVVPCLVGETQGCWGLWAGFREEDIPGNGNRVEHREARVGLIREPLVRDKTAEGGVPVRWGQACQCYMGRGA